MNLDGAARDALLALLRRLDEIGYHFVAPTPATHAKILARPSMKKASDLRGILGWSLPFDPGLISRDLLSLLERADALESVDGGLKSKLRVSSVAGRLFLHSAYPTESEDSVFLGPDTYRFVHLLERALPGIGPVSRLVDQGTGAGVGGIVAAAMLPGTRITLLDVNRFALGLAAINAAHAGVDIELGEGGDLGAVHGEIDCLIANPPYMMDDGARNYRDGGDMHGAQLSFDWTIDAARRLRPGGAMILYTGSAIVDGCDELHEALERSLPTLGCTLDYREEDPDVFGEDLEKPAYADVERIAIVSAVVRRA